MFQKLVRANAVITGEESAEVKRSRKITYTDTAETSQDKGLDATTLLNNAANNLRLRLKLQSLKSIEMAEFGT